MMIEWWKREGLYQDLKEGNNEKSTGLTHYVLFTFFQTIKIFVFILMFDFIIYFTAHS